MGPAFDIATAEELNVGGKPSSQAAIISRRSENSTPGTSSFSATGAHNSVCRILPVRENKMVLLL